jgi:hypothetical protein
MPDASKFGTELKRYNIKPGTWDEFMEVWRRIVAVRKRHGFGILFALVDKEKNVFTWAIDHEDIDEAARRYYADPERIELEIVGNYVTGYEITRVQQQAIP